MQYTNETARSRKQWESRRNIEKVFEDALTKLRLGAPYPAAIAEGSRGSPSDTTAIKSPDTMRRMARSEAVELECHYSKHTLKTWATFLNCNTDKVNRDYDGWFLDIDVDLGKGKLILKKPSEFVRTFLRGK